VRFNTPRVAGRFATGQVPPPGALPGSRCRRSPCTPCDKTGDHSPWPCTKRSTTTRRKPSHAWKKEMLEVYRRGLELYSVQDCRGATRFFEAALALRQGEIGPRRSTSNAAAISSPSRRRRTGRASGCWPRSRPPKSPLSCPIGAAAPVDKARAARCRLIFVPLD